jgi:hypothetical protein
MSGRFVSLWFSLFFWVFSTTILHAQEIPQRDITELKEDLDEAGEARSSTRKRLAYKRVIRDGETLIKEHSDATNRWQVLGVMYQGQRKLFELDDSSRNRDALFEICETLRQAPDAYADLRLDADLLLMERDMSEKNADVRERTTELSKLLNRYRDTPGEARSLKMALLIAPKLDAFDLEKEIVRTLDERFSGNHDVVTWRRKHQGFSHFRLLFTGEYKRVDGTKLVFPIDGVGHTCLLFFWSKDIAETESKFAELKDMQSRIPGQFKLFSFNLDDLPDAGQQILNEKGLDAIPMLLPGGRDNKIYQVYSARDPFLIRVNAHGHVFSPTELITEELKEMPMEANFDDERYLAQIQSLVNGDFLVQTPSSSDTIPADTLNAIKECWVSPPFRYRLSEPELSENYRKALELCESAIQKHPDAPDLWQVRNLKILAFMGMWKLKMEPQYLEVAATEANLVLPQQLPSGGDVVARLCLAKAALRNRHYLDWAPIREFVAAYGVEAVPTQVYAAAAMLALEMNAKELFEEYREKLLTRKDHEPWIFPVLTFLEDPVHRYRLFKSNFYLPPSLARRIERATLRTIAADRNRQDDPSQKIQADFKTLEGEIFRIPEAAKGKTTLFMFVEPPTDPNANFPAAIKGEITIDSRGKEQEFVGAMQRAFQMVDERLRKNFQVIAAFLSEDAELVKGLMEKNQWTCQAVMVPGGLANPLVQRLGILSADRLPNIVLLKPDGTLAWKLSGIVHPQVRAEGKGELMGVVELSLKWNILKQDMELDVQAFANSSSYSDALFTDPYPQPNKPRIDAWSVLRHHGRAVALFKNDRWNEALVEVNAAIEIHEMIFNRKKVCPCQSVASLLHLKADILEKLGKAPEVAQIRKRAEEAKLFHNTRYYRTVHQRLTAMSADQKEKSP